MNHNLELAVELYSLRLLHLEWTEEKVPVKYLIP